MKSSTALKHACLGLALASAWSASAAVAPMLSVDISITADPSVTTLSNISLLVYQPGASSMWDDTPVTLVQNGSTWTGTAYFAAYQPTSTVSDFLYAVGGHYNSPTLSDPAPLALGVRSGTASHWAGKDFAVISEDYVFGGGTQQQVYDAFTASGVSTSNGQYFTSLLGYQYVNNEVSVGPNGGIGYGQTGTLLTFSNATSSGTFSIIPEPSTWALAAGALALGFAVWRRRS